MSKAPRSNYRPNRGGGKFNKPNEKPDNTDPTDSSVKPRVKGNQATGNSDKPQTGTKNGRDRAKNTGSANQGKGNRSSGDTKSGARVETKANRSVGASRFGGKDGIKAPIRPDSRDRKGEQVNIIRQLESLQGPSSSEPINAGLDFNVIDEMPKKAIYAKGGRQRSQAPVQNLHMTEQNQDMIHDMLKDLQIEPVSDALDDIDFDELERDEEYWGSIGDQRLQIQDVLTFAGFDGAKTDENFTDGNPYALRKLLQSGFEKQRCIDALKKYDDDVGAALEALLVGACKLENIGKVNPEFTPELYEEAKFQRGEELVAIQSIYEDTFTEAIPDRLWIIKLSMPFIEELYTPKPKKNPRTEKEKKPTPNKNICRFYLKGNCRYGYLCKKSHAVEEVEEEKDDRHLQTDIKAMIFNLEVRFPEGSIYPFEPPIITLYTTHEFVPPHVSLNITLRLSNEAMELTKSGLPVLFSLISLLEDKDELMKYIERPPSEYSRSEESVRTLWVAQPGLQDAEGGGDDNRVDMTPKERRQKKDISVDEKETLNRKLKLQFAKQK
ncbi:predicted protein, partial [Nematostella vectensis]